MATKTLSEPDNDIKEEVKEEVKEDVKEEIKEQQKENQKEKSKNATKCKIYARGSNDDGHLSTDKFGLMADGWTELTELSNIVVNYENLYKQHESFSVITESNEIYVVGNNNKNKLGIITDIKNDKIPHLTKVPFDNISNGIPILLSHGINGKEHSFIYTSKNKLFASGLNWCGEFGTAKTGETGINQIIPQFWNKNEKFIDIQCGSHSSFFLTDLGNLYGVGYHECIGSDDNISNPILLYKDIKQIAVGIWHSLILDKNGKLIINAGRNHSSEITSDSAKEKICSFFNKNDKLKIKNMHSGWRHCMIICENGEMYTFGNNQKGQIGNDNVEEDGDKIVETPYLVKLDEGDDENEYIVQGSCGATHCMALSNYNNVYCWGNNFARRCYYTLHSEIYWPRRIHKKNNLLLDEKTKIKKVIATNNASLIVVEQ